MLAQTRSLVESLEVRTLLAAGALDASFAQGGTIIPPIEPLQIPAAVVALADGGVLVAARQANAGPERDFSLFKLNPSGGLDQNFGVKTIDFGAADDVADMIALPDGKFVLAGASFDFSSSLGRVAIARLNADGSLDTTFSGDGKLLIDDPDDDLTAAAVVRATGDGKLIVGGQSSVARVTADGTLDASFGTNGIHKIVTDGRSGLLQSLFIAPDGKVWVAERLNGFRREYLVARLTTSGGFDNTLSGDGRVYFPLGGNDVYIAPLAGNKAILANIGGLGDSVQFRRINPDGGQDATFGNAGVVRIPITGVNATLRQLIAAPNGKLLATGFSGAQLSNQINTFVARINVNGTVDAAFGTQGVAFIDIAGNNTPGGFAVARDGKIIVAGSSSQRLDSPPDTFINQAFAARLIGTETEPSARVTATGTLLVQGSELAETITIDTITTAAGKRVRVSINGIVTTFPARNVKRQVVFAADGNDLIAMRSTVGASFEAHGDGGNDAITGNGRANILRGGEGDDTLSGFGGDDALVGNAGNDSLLAGSGDDNAEGGTGNDTLFGATGQDTLNGGADTDTAIDPASDILISIEN